MGQQKTNSTVTILDAVRHPRLFGRWFKGSSWAAWFAFLAALFGLPMTPEQLALYQQHTGRSAPPAAPVREAWLCVGRRGGKSIIAAVVAVFLACFRDYTPYLAPGEVATVMVVAADRKQARVVWRYIRGFISAVPTLKRMIVRETKDVLELSNRVAIEIHTASFKAVRGYTLAAVVNDEVAYWPTDDSAEPDKEIIAAERPAMATIPGAVMLSISSPYARRGTLWDAYREHWGREDSPVLFWKGASREMNPQLDEAVVAEAYARDPEAAKADFGAEFRTDVEKLVTREIVEACVVSGRTELPPATANYYAFVDPSGGSADSMTLAIAHQDADGRAILDCLRERRPPFSPDAVVDEFASVVRSYGLAQVTGDRYAGEWPRERFRKHGVEYLPGEKDRSALYRELLPALNSGRAELLDNAKLTAQLVGLERRTSRGGKDLIDHAPGGHDDLANAAAGALESVCQPVLDAPRAHVFHFGADGGAMPEGRAGYVDESGVVHGLGPERWWKRI